MAMISEERVEFNKQHMRRMIGYTDAGMENPVTIQDKLRWLNIYDAEPLKSDCADKLKVKEFARRVTGDDLGVPTLKVWNSADEMNLDGLPEKFVLKCNHGSGMNIIIRDKNTVNIEDVRSQLGKWMNQDFTFRNGFESHYHWIVRKVFAEELIGDGTGNLKDYKFWCFNGEPKFWTINDGNGHGNWMNFYDMQKNLLPYTRTDFAGNPPEEIIIPDTYEKMVCYAQKLSNCFKFVRVDFYDINGRIYLGELTFTPGAFMFRFTKNEDDTNIGNMLSI
jgi:hypothetical protein